MNKAFIKINQLIFQILNLVPTKCSFFKFCFFCTFVHFLLKLLN